MAKTVNIHHAKTQLSRLIEEALAGEEIVVAKAGKPMVTLVPFREVRARRRGGQFAGRVRESADCWVAEADPFGGSLDAPLLDAFPEGGPHVRIAELRASDADD